MIEEQMQWKDITCGNQRKVGLGYESVPPPFNHNYIAIPLSQEEIDREPFLVYGKPTSEQATKSNDKILDTNISTLSADVSVVQGEQEAEKSESNNSVSKFGVEFCDESVLNSNTKVFVSGGVLFHTDNFENNGVVSDKIAKSDLNASTSSTFATQSSTSSCKCENARKYNKDHKSDKSSTQSNDNKQICFNCGTAGHIARNCLNRMFVHHMLKRGENESRGRSLIRKSSRTRSRDDAWKTNQNKKMEGFQKNKQVFNKFTNSLPKSTQAKPKSISSKSRSGSSNSSSRKSTCSKKTKKKIV